MVQDTGVDTAAVFNKAMEAVVTVNMAAGARPDDLDAEAVDAQLLPIMSHRVEGTADLTSLLLHTLLTRSKSITTGVSVIRADSMSRSDILRQRATWIGVNRRRTSRLRGTTRNKKMRRDVTHTQGACTKQCSLEIDG